MPKFVKRPVPIQAEQFFYDKPMMVGVFYPPTQGGFYIGDAFVVTAHEQRVYLQNGDWIVPEMDGFQSYSIKDEIFREFYTPLDETNDGAG